MAIRDTDTEVTLTIDGRIVAATGCSQRASHDGGYSTRRQKRNVRRLHWRPDRLQLRPGGLG